MSHRVRTVFFNPEDYQCKDCQNLYNWMDYYENEMEDMLKILYGEDELDLEKLQFYLEGIANFYEIEMPKGKLKIERQKEPELSPYAKQLIDLNQFCLKQMYQ